LVFCASFFNLKKELKMSHGLCKTKLNLVSRHLVVALFGLASSCALADDVVDLGTVGTAGGAGQSKDLFVNRGTAAAVSPSQSNLEVGQPQSIVSRAFIEDAIAPTSTYYDILALTPSVVTTPSSNGPGFSDGAKATLRGFADGYYNITFDGIPFGDTNDPTHHSISYFPAQVLGGVVVERGPGNASNLGQATYGGTVSLLSKSAMAERNTTVYGSYGNWDSSLMGLAYESGRLKDYGDATVQFNYQYEHTNGYQSYADIQNTDYLLKFQRPLGDHTVVTALATYNDLREHLPDSINGPTLAQVAAYGQSYLMNNDSASQGFYGYNPIHKTSDFEYIRLQTFWNQGFETDNRTYTYAYNNATIAGCKAGLLDNPAGIAAQPSHCKTSPAVASGQVVGYDKLNAYRVWGDIFKATQETAYGLARFGFWWETANTSRHNIGYNLSTGTDIAFTSAQVGSGFIQQSGWNQYQPFAEFEWKPLAGLTVTPGYKYVNFQRHVWGPYNQGASGASQDYSDKYSASLPFLTVNYLLNKQNSVYAQFAQGLQIPTLSTMQNTTVATNSPLPTRTTNYQLGFVHKSDRLVADADVYYIKVSDSQALDTNSSSPTYNTWISSGNVTYKGVEGEITYVLGGGYSAYLNGSINTATYDAGNSNQGQVANVPRGTAGMGMLYRQGPWKGTLLGKFVGYQYAAAGNTFRIAPYSTVDGNISYTFKLNNDYAFKDVTTQFAVYNLLDHQAITSYSPSGSTPSSSDQVTFQAPRSFMVTVKANF
jgi:iron complex outermembrane receptor protein